MISDERLCEAARQAEKNLLAGLPEPKDCEAAFSPGFQRKMKKLICRTDHPIRYWVQKAVACILLVILLGGGSVLALSSEARAVFAGWVREIYDSWFVYWYTGESPSVPEYMVYCPTWVPDGYELEVKPEPGPHMTAIYRNTEGDVIVFSCSKDMESTTLQIGQEDTQLSNIYVNHIPADFYTDNIEGNANHLIWEDKQQQMVFWIISTLDVESMVRIAENIKLIE